MADFDLAFARDTLLPLATLAYHPPYALPPGWSLISAIQPNDFGFIASNGRQTIVSIRGTQSTEEWIEDADFAHVKCTLGAPGDVHAGFQLQTTQILDSIIANTKDPGQIIVSGHSLGAAIAILVSARLTAIGDPPVACYTWGGPRVSYGPTFANWCDQFFPTYRIVNYFDIVPDAPLAQQGYQHCGNEIEIFETDFSLWSDPKALLRYHHDLPTAYEKGLAKPSAPVNLKVSL